MKQQSGCLQAVKPWDTAEQRVMLGALEAESLADVGLVAEQGGRNQSPTQTGSETSRVRSAMEGADTLRVRDDVDIVQEGERGFLLDASCPSSLPHNCRTLAALLSSG